MKCNGVSQQNVVWVAVGGARKNWNFSVNSVEVNVRLGGRFLLSAMNLPPTPDIDSLSASTNEQIGFYTAEQFDAFQ